MEIHVDYEQLFSLTDQSIRDTCDSAHLYGLEKKRVSTANMYLVTFVLTVNTDLFVGLQ